MGFTLDDLEKSEVKVTIKYLENGDRYEVGPQGGLFSVLKAAMGFRLAQSDLTLDGLEGSKTKSHFLM